MYLNLGLSLIETHMKQYTCTWNLLALFSYMLMTSVSALYKETGWNSFE